MVHSGQLKAMPARYTPGRGSLAVLHPLIACWESDLAEFATLSGFPILPCNLCSNQANLQRPQVKLLLNTALSSLNPTSVKTNMLRAIQDVRPSHLLDQTLRQACGMDAVKGEYVKPRGDDRLLSIHGEQDDDFLPI
jgi:tRNA 2-thiocytidine biosynthesis protein TtcA